MRDAVLDKIRDFVSGCEGPSIAESCSMRVVSFVKPTNLILSLVLDR